VRGYSPLAIRPPWPVDRRIASGALRLSHPGALIALGVGAMAAGAALAHLEVLRAEHGFSVTNAGSVLFGAGVAVLVWPYLARLGRAGTAIAIVAILALALLAFSRTPLGRHPWINDISTDLESPPPLHPGGPAATAVPYPQAFVPAVRQHYADLAPLRLALAPANALRKVHELVLALPGVADVRLDPATGTVHAVAVTRLFRFRDDFVVRVRADGDGSRVDVRSRSRVGKSDLGANAGRIRDLLARLASR
jgi:uncharacterized protein (DUF1499 family)